ncbi:hypothetical protein HMPREF1032_00949 [Subdoligranulum sp. 4_3_54A2FAA]|nr:hypothetical protein HMPREF1032_00949 [Subdoligranulum sp. 4_3_54A2FAA]
MASLTHVCMWSDNGWKRITAEQAARLHPGGTVSAHSGLFMCELCGQYVILTDGDIRIRYFKHSAYEKSKDCPERTFGAGYSISYGSQEHDLPIRITSVSSSSFSFEIGLIRAPISFLNKDFRIEIKPKGAFDVSYVFTKERLNYDSITYLPIGERPFEKYTLNFQNGSDKLREFWPAEIKGIDPEGTLFEKVSGKKLSYDADVEIGKEYYLLKRGYIYCALPGFVDSKNEEKTERNAGYLVVSHSGGGMLRQGTRKGIRRTPANRGMRAHRIVKSLDISEDVCHGLCP